MSAPDSRLSMLAPGERTPKTSTVPEIEPVTPSKPLTATVDDDGTTGGCRKQRHTSIEIDPTVEAGRATCMYAADRRCALPIRTSHSNRTINGESSGGEQGNII